MWTLNSRGRKSGSRSRLSQRRRRASHVQCTMTEIRWLDRYVWYLLGLHICYEHLIRYLCVIKVTIRVRDGKKTTHEGIKVEFVGSIGTPPTLTAANEYLSIKELRRTVLRSWAPPRISIAIPGARSSRGDAPGADLRLQLQECREAIRELPGYKC